MTDALRAALPRYRWPPSLRVFLAIVGIALLCSLAADLRIVTRTPWLELQRMAAGFIAPHWLPLSELLTALAQTLAFALLAVSSAAALGFALALHYQRSMVRRLCTITRAVHELFWGLLFVQLIGLYPLAGILAIALPYTGIFAKVYAEILEEDSGRRQAALPRHSDAVSQFWYGRWPRLRESFASYTLYRLECGLRSSTILGFIGLPTLGFHLDSGFMQGDYAQVAGLLLIFYALIASIRFWARPGLMPVYLVAALVYLWTPTPVDLGLLAALAQDAIPAPLRLEHIDALPWLQKLLFEQLLPGLANTLLVAQMALALTGLIALACFPLMSRQFAARPVRGLTHLLLVVLRSTPELMIAFALLLLWGPSMLPAVVALAIHNGAIIGHLTARHSNALMLRSDASHGLNRYSFEVLPRVYGQFLAFLLYRWEIILRESAIVGLLGIQTLGFFIDSAFESFRLDVALILIGSTALLNIGVDGLSQGLRRRLRVESTPLALTPCERAEN